MDVPLGSSEPASPVPTRSRLLPIPDDFSRSRRRPRSPTHPADVGAPNARPTKRPRLDPFAKLPLELLLRIFVRGRNEIDFYGFTLILITLSLF